MAEVHILVEGYLSSGNSYHVCPTITLVKSKGLNILVDPGTTKNQNVIKKGLEKYNLKPRDINVVFITHAHTDHYRNAGMFNDAKILDYWGWWEGDTWKPCKGNVNEEIKVIKTPGHSYDSVTMLVKTDKGVIAICGDVFWKENYPEEDPYAHDHKKLEDSREKLMKIADWIIPGHGKMFKVKARNNI